MKARSVPIESHPFDRAIEAALDAALQKKLPQIVEVLTNRIAERLAENLPRHEVTFASLQQTTAEFLSLKECWEKLGISRSSLQRLIRANEFPKPVEIIPGKRRVGVREADFRAWLAKHQNSAQSDRSKWTPQRKKRQ